ncbi:MAG: DUF3379 domain-containing protein [Actinobacteria bacterium]|nr:DUF3379 domain-containing protein [Actinomycetota bacterium]
MKTPRDLINAYLDDEVDVDERLVVDQALNDSSDLRAELDQLIATRQLVRDLPLLAMPEDLAVKLQRRSPFGPQARPRRQNRTRAAALSAFASVAFWGVLVGTNGAGSVVPDVAGVVFAHQSAVAADDSGADSSDLPEAVGDSFVREEVREMSGMRHGIYSDGDHEISVFVLRGPVDWDEMPLGDRVPMTDGSAWFAVIEGDSVLVIDRADKSYAIVGTTKEQVVAVAESLPDPSRSLRERITDASRETVEFFGLSG